MVTKTPTESARTVVQRVVTPLDGDVDVLPLYMDFNPSGTKEGEPGTEQARDELATATQRGFVSGRHSLTLPPNNFVSFGTYFNAFPASYWRAWTTVESVRLTVEVKGHATVVVYRSSARGVANRHDSRVVDDGGTIDFDLPLKNFGDGGWYWFDLLSAEEPAELLKAHWSVETPEGYTPGTASVAVTTFNRPDFCVRQIRNFANDPALLEVVDRLIITDQGNDKVTAQHDYEAAAAELGDRLKIVEQGNLGGSGGFSRGMHEASVNESSDYALLLDDDVLAETEGIVRAVKFADFCRTPTLVGGHMFNLYERTVLHTFGEGVDEHRFFWGPMAPAREAHDFALHNLRSTPWMHRRIDVDFNGWWMCLIPTKVIKEIGYSLPVFIKWDDAEFGLRARRAGYPTVSFPGAAVWHVPWTEKDDTIDWQAYYHQRNRWLAAMLYSPFDKGGVLPRESFMVDVKHLLSLQYSAVELRHDGLKDLLRGPNHLHKTLGTKLGQIRSRRKEFTDARVEVDLGAFPAPRSNRPLGGGEPNGRRHAMRMALKGGLRQLRPVSPDAGTTPEARMAAMDTRWWRLSHHDSVLVSSADGVGASWYIRDRAQFIRMLRRSIKLHLMLRRRWDSLAEEYRRAHSDLVSPETWQKTFDKHSA